MNTRPNITLQPASSQARVVMLLLTIGLPFFMTCLAFTFMSFGQVPTENMIGNSMVITMLIVLPAEIILTSALWYFLNRAMSRHRIEWQSDGFIVLTSFYKQSYARKDFLLDSAMVVNLENDKAHRPIFKTNGYSVPGFKSGWFRLRNRQSAFCAMGEGKRILLLPTNKGHCLMLGTAAPEKTLEQLKHWAIQA